MSLHVPPAKSHGIHVTGRAQLAEKMLLLFEPENEEQTEVVSIFGLPEGTDACMFPGITCDVLTGSIVGLDVLTILENGGTVCPLVDSVIGAPAKRRLWDHETVAVAAVTCSSEAMGCGSCRDLKELTQRQQSTSRSTSS
eukprot:scaffold7215_cov366-Prasinococcus_capsulatus_cf.AAC.13